MMTTKGYRHTEETKRKISKNNGYGMLGRHHSEETKKRISAKEKGKRLGNLNPSKRPEVRAKMSKVLKGRKITWNNKIKDTIDRRLKEDLEFRQQFHEKNSKRIKEWHKTHPYQLNSRHHTEETKQKIGLATRKRLQNPIYRKYFIETCRKVSVGQKHSLDTRRKMSIGQKKSWQEIRGKIWTKEKRPIPYNKYFWFVKPYIKLRDNFQCQICEVDEQNLSRQLSIHHIDYDRQNNSDENLISLCMKCHMKTNFKRNEWMNILQTKAFYNHGFLQLVENTEELLCYL